MSNQPRPSTPSLGRTHATPPPEAMGRVASTATRDPIHVLLENVRDLEAGQTAWRVAGICSAALTLAFRARAVIIHHLAPDARELRIIAVDGPNGHHLLGSAVRTNDDFIATGVLLKRKPVSMRFEGPLADDAPRRFSVVGAARSVVAVPVIAAGRCLAIIEVIDADARIEDRVREACDVVTRRLVGALSDRPAEVVREDLRVTRPYDVRLPVPDSE